MTEDLRRLVVRARNLMRGDPTHPRWTETLELQAIVGGREASPGRVAELAERIERFVSQSGDPR